MKYFGKLLFIIFFGLVLVANSGVGTAWAHANYVRSDPADNSSLPAGQPPTRIQVWFSEGVEPKFSELQVLNDRQERVDNGDSRVPSDQSQTMIITLKPGLPDGAYTVLYKTTSADDGHIVKNSFAFAVGVGAMPMSDSSQQMADSTMTDDNFNFWSVVLRWLNYLGGATLIGGVAWQLLIWQPALRKVSDQIGPEQVTAGQIAQQRGRFLLTLALVELVLGWIGWLLYQGTSLSGVSLPELFGNHAFGDMLFSTRFGIVWILRLVVLILTGLILLFISGKISWLKPGLPLGRRFNLMPEAEPPVISPMTITLESDNTVASNNLGYWLLLVCGGLLMLTTLFNSHATTDPAWLLIPADWLHLVSTGFWVGGLFYLALALPPALAALRPGTGDRTRLLSALISNFSFLGIITVTVLLITGTLQAAIHLGALDLFFNTPYGIALSVKLVVVAILLLFGAYHLLKVSPALRGYARRKGEKNGAGSLAAGQLQAQFRRTVMLEALLGLVLLGIIGGLTSFGPPVGETVAKSGLTLKGQAADLNYVMRVDPAQIGNNNLDVSLIQNNGQPLVQTGGVLIRLNMVDMDMGVQELELKPVPNMPGHYQKQGYILSMSGQWLIELIVRRDGKEDTRTPIQFKVNK